MRSISLEDAGRATVALNVFCHRQRLPARTGKRNNVPMNANGGNRTGSGKLKSVDPGLFLSVPGAGRQRGRKREAPDRKRKTISFRFWHARETF